MAMTDEHKKALAEGRRQAAAIKRYLEALASRRPGRVPSPENLKKRIEEIKQKIAEETDQLKKVDLVQKRIDLEKRLKEVTANIDLEKLREDFIKYAKAYSERKGITYSAWREAGVPAADLKEAGIPRTRNDASES